MAKIIDRKQGTFDDIEIPEIVYKYRTWSNSHHKKIITNREVFFSPPSSFPDPLDCKFPIRWDLLTDDQIFIKYYTFSRENCPERTESDHISFAKGWIEKTPIKNISFVEERKKSHFEAFNNGIGVLSLTENPSSASMWDKYAKSHKGFCVGFNPKVLFQFAGGGDVVNYVNRIPIIYPLPFHDYYQQRNLQIFHKLKKWEFEQEYRLIIFSINGLDKYSRTKFLPPEAYSKILLGRNISKTDEDAIRKSVERDIGQIEIRKMD